MSRLPALLAVSCTAAAAIVVSCGSRPSSSGLGGSGGEDGGSGGSEGGSFGFSQVDCTSQGKPKDATTIVGTVYDPAGKHGVYNAIVYVAGGPLVPFPSGVTCDRCGTIVSGNPVVSALSDPTGHFELRDVPVGDVTLVVQVGKWRRQTTVSGVKACVDNTLTDPNLTRLPASHAEGDLPQIALVTGGCDAFECVLRKIGVADGEFTGPPYHGRVHVYQGSGGAGQYGSQPATTLWSNLDLMKQYDLVINSCECGEHPEEKPAGSLQNHLDYVGAGGRVFDTHYNYYWILNGPAPFPSMATFSPGAGGPDTTVATIDTSFPKGDAFAQWMAAVGASPTKGQLPIQQARYDAVMANPPTTRWVYGTNGSGGASLFHFSFDTPVGVSPDQQCGKVLFSDFHAAAGSNTQQVPFPGECNSDPLTPQEAALEFMLFDLSGCIQNDMAPPQPPPK